MKHSPGFLALVKEVMPRVREIGAPDAALLVEKNEAILIDVREDNEWQAGHAVGAIHMSRGIIERDVEMHFPEKSTALVLYCGGGCRSALSADSLQKMGYTNVRSMAGGWRSGNEAKLPVSF